MIGTLRRDLNAADLVWPVTVTHVPLRRELTPTVDNIWPSAIEELQCGRYTRQLMPGATLSASGRIDVSTQYFDNDFLALAARTIK